MSLLAIEEQFKKKFSLEIIHALRAMFDLGYENVDKLLVRERGSFLNNALIKDIRADLLRVSIASAAELFCKKGILPFAYETRPNLARNCHHVQLKGKDGIILYLARVNCPNEIPHKALYRPVLNNIQLSLFEESSKLPQVKVFTATYGDSGENVFKFGSIGIVGEKTWICYEDLVPGVYNTYTSDVENEEMLVSIKDTFEDGVIGGKDIFYRREKK